LPGFFLTICKFAYKLDIAQLTKKPQRNGNPLRLREAGGETRLRLSLLPC